MALHVILLLGQVLMSMSSNPAFNLFIKPMDYLSYLGFLSFSEKPLLISG
jgi:hypothetical protein